MTTQPNVPSRRSLLNTSTALRVLASAVFIPCFIIITMRGGYHFLALIDIVIFIGLWEFYAMMTAKGLRPYRTIGIVSGLALSLYVFFHNGVYANLFLTMGLLAIVMACGRWLELRLEPPIGRVSGLVSMSAMLLISIVLMFYREPLY